MQTPSAGPHDQRRRVTNHEPQFADSAIATAGAQILLDPGQPDAAFPGPDPGIPLLETKRRAPKRGREWPGQAASQRPQAAPSCRSTTTSAKPSRVGHEPPADDCQSTPADSDAALEFGRFRILLRRRELLADGLPVPLGTRAFDLLLVLIEAEGSLVSKAELMDRVWPHVIVGQDNLKVQISELRAALGADRDIIRTEFGRGYRFTGIVRPTTTISTASALLAQEAFASKEAALPDLTAIRSRLTSLEIQLAEALALLADKPRQTVREFRRRCTEPPSRRRVSERPRKIADWVAGG